MEGYFYREYNVESSFTFEQPSPSLLLKVALGTLLDGIFACFNK